MIPLAEFPSFQYDKCIFYALMEIQCTMRLKLGFTWLANGNTVRCEISYLRTIQLFPKVQRAHDRSFYSMQWLQSFVTNVHAHIQVKSRDKKTESANRMVLLVLNEITHLID